MWFKLLRPRAIGSVVLSSVLIGGGVSTPAQAATSPSVTATISGINGAYAVAFSPDSRTAYVVEANSNSLAVIDVATQAVTHIANVGSYPNAVVVSNNGAFAYVSAGSDNVVKEIRLSDGTVTRTWSVGAYPDGLALSPDGAYLYSANYGGFSVSEITLASGAVVTTGVGEATDRLVVSPDGAHVYYTIDHNDTVGSLMAPGLTNGIVLSNSVSIPVGIAVNVEGTSLFVTSLGTHNLSKIDASTGASLGTLAAGGGTMNVGIAGATGFVINDQGLLTLFDPTSFSSLATLATGAQVQGAAISPDASTVVIADAGNGRVTIVATGVAPAPSNSGVLGRRTTKPEDVIQEYSVAADEVCGIDVPASVEVPAFGTEMRQQGWSKSYAQWPNGNRGGWTCVRILTFDMGSLTWKIAQ